MTKPSPYNTPDYVELYERLGGAAAVGRLAADFTAALTGDEQLKPFFEGVDAARLAGAHRAFFTMIFGGPNAYDGLDLRRAHAGARGHGLTDAHLARAIAHFRAALAIQDLAPALIAEAEGYLQSMRDDMLGL